MAWELEGTVQATYRLLCNAIENKNILEPKPNKAKKWRDN
jgi:hypothetical protein